MISIHRHGRAALPSILVLAMAMGSAPAHAQGQLNLFCSVQVEWCQAIVTSFQKASGITINMTQKGSGETLAQIRAEAQNPRGDV